MTERLICFADSTFTCKQKMWLWETEFLVPLLIFACCLHGAWIVLFAFIVREKLTFALVLRLARWDHIVEWVKPKQCPRGLKKKLFDQLPERILLREVRFHIPIKGFRTEDVTLVTTLLDPKDAN